MEDPLIGRNLGTYRIERVLGRGGMALVYYALDTRLNRPVAVKVIDARYRDDQDYAQRFLQEAQAAAALRHPNIVQVYHADEEGGLFYFAMEYVDGTDLGRVLREHAKAGTHMTRLEVLRIVRVVGGALDYIHEMGLVHRDVKPSNILIARDGRIVLTDFGLVLDVAQGSIGTAFGSPRYIAPEQAVSSANAVPQSDLYSLGAILYEMLAGQPPFDGTDPMQVAMMHLSDEPKPLRGLRPDLPPEVETVVQKALAKGVTGRYPSGADFAEALASAWPPEIGEAAERALPPPLAAISDTETQRKSLIELQKEVAASGPASSWGPLARLVARGAAFTQDQLAGTTFALLCLALLAWLGIAGHAASIPWLGLWFAPAVLVVLGIWLLYRRWWLLAGGEALTGVAIAVAGMGWGRWVALGAMVGCGGLLAFGLVYLARKGGALAGLRKLRERVGALDLRLLRPAPKPAPAAAVEKALAAREKPPRKRPQKIKWPRSPQRPETVPEQTPVTTKEISPAVAPTGNGGGPFWSAVAGWWPSVVQQGVALAWLQLGAEGSKVVAHLAGEQKVLEKLYRSGVKTWGGSVEWADVQSGYLALSCRPQGKAAAAIPDDLRTLIPVGAGSNEELWLCLAGRGHAVYVAEDATAPAAALRAAAVALLVQMGERVQLAVCDPGFHLAGLRRAVRFYTTSKEAYNDWLTDEIYDMMMDRLGRVERGLALEGEPWWVLIVGDSSGLEAALEVILARGREARVILLALTLPQSESGRRLIRRAKTVVCYSLRSEQASWEALGHSGAAELQAGEVLVTLEAPGGAVRLPATGVFVDDAVVAQVLRRVQPEPKAEAPVVPLPQAAWLEGGAAPEAPAVITPAPEAPAVGGASPLRELPEDVRAILEVVFSQGNFGVRSVYRALGGKIGRDQVLEIGRELEAAGIVGPPQGKKGRVLMEGMTPEAAVALWMAYKSSKPAPAAIIEEQPIEEVPMPVAAPLTPSANELVGLPADVQAVLRLVLNNGKFRATEVFIALRGEASMPRVIEIGRQLEEAGIIRAVEGDVAAGGELADGMTAAEAAALWQYFFPAGGAALPVSLAAEHTPKPAPAEEPPQTPAEIPSWLANLLRE